MPVNRTRPAAPAALDEGVTPLLALQNAFRYWWVLTALTMTGALIGWAAHLSRPVLYESIARLPVGFDYVSTGPMSQFEEDIAMEVVGGLLTANDVMDRAAARALETGYTLDAITMRQMAIVERRLNVWELRVRAEDPATAEQIAALWMGEAHAVISESYRHAVLADSLNRYTRSLETCLARAAVSEPVSVQCSDMNFEAIQAGLVQAGEQLNEELTASRGLFVGLRIGQPETAGEAVGPVRYGRAGFALGGALIGLVIAVALLETGLISRLLRRS